MGMRALLLAVLVLLPGLASAQGQHRSFGEIHVRAARLVTLAPLCGLRDADWARRLERGVSAARHEVTAEGQREGLAGAALAMTVGTRLFETYGPAICREAEDPMRWRDAEDLARGDHGAEPPLPRLPEAVTALGWRAFVATLAMHCELRDRRWGRSAGAGLRRAMAMEDGLGSDPDVRRGLAWYLVGTAESMANLVHAMPGLRPCRALWRTDIRAELSAVDEAAAEWRRLCPRRRPDASCRLGERPP